MTAESTVILYSIYKATRLKHNDVHMRRTSLQGQYHTIHT